MRRALAWLLVASACSPRPEPPATRPEPAPPDPTRPVVAAAEPSLLPAPQRAPDPVPPSEQARFQALRLDAQGALSAFGNRHARWSPDRRSMVLLSNRDGPWKAYLVGWRALDLPPLPVPGPDAPILDADFHPDGRHVLLLAGSKPSWTLHLSDPEARSVHPWGPAGLHPASIPLRPPSTEPRSRW